MFLRNSGIIKSQKGVTGTFRNGQGNKALSATSHLSCAHQT